MIDKRMLKISVHDDYDEPKSPTSENDKLEEKLSYNRGSGRLIGLVNNSYGTQSFANTLPKSS